MTDELIRKYAGEIKRIVEGNTMGDFTWEGLLFSFLRDVDESRTLHKVETFDGDTVKTFSVLENVEAPVKSEPEPKPVYDVFYNNTAGVKELYAHKVSYEDAQNYVMQLSSRTNPTIIQNTEDEENRFYDVQIWSDMWYDAARHCSYDYANSFSEELKFEYRVIDHDPSRQPVWPNFNIYNKG